MDLLATWKKIKDQVIKSDLELKLKESIEDEPSTNYLTLVEEINLKTENKEDLEVIKKFINKKLNSKKWKRILKTLKLILFLIKGASEDFISYLKWEKEKIKGLSTYYYQVNGAADIREKSTQILEFFKDDKKLKAERETYQKIKRLSLDNSKRNSGGLLNSIGSYNVSCNTNEFGLTKNIKKDDVKQESDSESESESDSDVKTEHKTPIKYDKPLVNFEDILVNKEGNSQNAKKNSKMDILSMNDLFSGKSATTNDSNNNFIYDFTKK